MIAEKALRSALDEALDSMERVNVKIANRDGFEADLRDRGYILRVLEPTSAGLWTDFLSGLDAPETGDTPRS